MAYDANINRDFSPPALRYGSLRSPPLRAGGEKKNNGNSNGDTCDYRYTFTHSCAHSHTFRDASGYTDTHSFDNALRLDLYLRERGADRYQ